MSTIEDKLDQLKVQDETKNQENEDDDFVDPWTVTSKSDKGIDYDKLIRKSKKYMKQIYVCKLSIESIFSH